MDENAVPDEEIDAPPVQDEAPPVQEEAPPVQEEAPVVQEDAPPVQDEAPPVQEESPPVQEEASAVQEDAPIADEDALPVKGNARRVKIDSVAQAYQDSETDNEFEDLPEDTIDETIDGTMVGEGDEEGELEEEEEYIIIQEDYVSGPSISEDGTIPLHIAEFDHSFAYDCKRYSNLCVADENVFIFASGSYLHIFNSTDQSLTFRRSALGDGIGHITKNPNPLYDHIAVACNGPEPPILIYEWPSMLIIFVLNEGTRRSYTHLNYSPDGLLLCSQGGEPDYNITIWDWLKHRIMLRIKSFSNDVITCRFSPYCPGQLTTAGLGHIKFWKMATTFTGLKLKGDLGRFGKTEICDIVGFYPMPDEKVLSGCDWGNILVWDAGLIKFEICRKARAPCHKAPITQFEYNEASNEVTSISMDGWICVWYWETVELADPPDDDRFVEVDPIYEFNLNFDHRSVSIMSIVKQNEDPLNFKWYAQDANGGIWLQDLSTEVIPGPKPKLKMRCHGGAVVALCSAPGSPHIASLGSNGRLLVHNYETKRLVIEQEYASSGGHMVWLPLVADPSGFCLAVGFGDGVLRLVAVVISNDTETSYGDGGQAALIQAIKPHSAPITRVSVNPSGKLLLTGSEDKTVFVFLLTRKGLPNVTPVGFIKVPAPVTFITWHPTKVERVLVTCLYGEMLETDVPLTTQNYTEISYHLSKLTVRECTFKSIKSEILQRLDKINLEKRREEKKTNKKLELDKLKRQNPGVEYDEDLFLEDSESSKSPPPLYFPPVPNRIIWAAYTPANTIWLSLANYDAGFIYECTIKDPRPLNTTAIAGTEDQEIHSIAYYPGRKYLVFGMQGGIVRINRFDPNNYHENSDYWILPMHDINRGKILDITFSHDGRFMFTGGEDGNIFSYVFTPEDGKYPPGGKAGGISKPPTSKDIDDPEMLSLEGVKNKAEYEELMRIANERKNKVLDLLAGYRNNFRKLIKKNKTLMDTQVIPPEDFCIDARINEDLEDTLYAKMDLLQQQMAFDLEKSKLSLDKVKAHFIDPLESYPCEVLAIRKNVKVKTFRFRKLDIDFFTARVDLEARIEAANNEGNAQDTDETMSQAESEVGIKLQPIESFLMGLSPSTIEHKLGMKIYRVLRKYRERKANQEQRKKEWDKQNALRPDNTKVFPEDLIELQEAKKSIGDYKLKMSDDFNVTEDLTETTMTKYTTLLNVREQIFNLRHDFNLQVFNLRDKKMELLSMIATTIEKLKALHEELPRNRQLPLPKVPELDLELEFPERYLKVTATVAQPKTQSQAGSDGAVQRRQRASTILKSIEAVVLPLDLEREVLGIYPIAGSNLHSIGSILNTIEVKQVGDYSDVDLTTLQSLSKNDAKETHWEREMKQMRLARKLFEQDQLLIQVETSLTQFDENVEFLNKLRVKVDVDAKFLELYLLTAHQELIILKEFEDMEMKLTEKVQEKATEKSDILAKQTKLQNTIENKTKQLAKNQEKVLELQTEFSSATADSKFADFLRKIYKKKWKPPRDPNDDSDEDSSSSSEDSSEEEDEDVDSLASGEIGPLRLDENVCPEGCDIKLYKLTFKLRAKRHDIEQFEKDELRVIDNIKKDIGVLIRGLKVVDQALETRKQELIAYQRLKLKKLNEVEMTIVLKLHKMQHLLPDNTLEHMEKSLVFSQGAVGNLYNRVGELKFETEHQVEKHRKNMRHLGRMKMDCHQMTLHIKKLKDDIQETMHKKFNRVVDLNEMDESVLRKMIHDLRVSMCDIEKTYNIEIDEWKDKVCEKKIEYSQVISENTEKLDILTVLQEEDNELAKVLKYQDTLQYFVSQGDILDDAYKVDLEKLRNIAKRQEASLTDLRREIKRLTMKSTPLPPIRPTRLPSVELPTPPKTPSVDSFTYFTFSRQDSVSEMGEEVSLEATSSQITAMAKELADAAEKEGILAEEDYECRGVICGVSVQDIVDIISSKLAINEPLTKDESDVVTSVKQSIEELVRQSIDQTMEGPVEDEEYAEPEQVKKKTAEEEKEIAEIVDGIFDYLLENLPISSETSIEASIQSIVEGLVMRLPIEKQVEKENIRSEAQKVVLDVIHGLDTASHRASTAILEAMYAESQIPMDLILEVLNNVMCRIAPTESLVQIAVQEVIRTMIECVPEALLTVRDNMKMVANQICKTMSVTSLEVVRIQGHEIVDAIVSYLEREGPLAITKSKITEIVHNMIKYMKAEVKSKDRRTSITCSRKDSRSARKSQPSERSKGRRRSSMKCSKKRLGSSSSGSTDEY